MAEPQNGRQTPERYEDTTDPKNPPNSVTNPQVRRAALGSALGPIVAFVVIVGLALVYWMNRPASVPDAEDRAQVGTTGIPDDRDDVVGERSRGESTPGGRNPASSPDSTSDEIKFRGGDQLGGVPAARRQPMITGLPMLEGEPKDVVGRRVEIRNVNVVDAQDASHFWIQDGNAKAEVTAPRGGPAVKNGSKVTLSGLVEEDGRGGVRIKADRVEMS